MVRGVVVRSIGSSSARPKGQSMPREGPSDSSDPRSIRSIAVTVEDVVAALEASRRSSRTAVLRVTPPFSGRMRARLHVEGEEGEYDGEIRPIHVPPDRLVENVPPYPDPDETAAELEEYDVERHRERHVEAVEAWRKTVRSRIATRATLPIDGDEKAVDVVTLGE